MNLKVRIPAPPQQKSDLTLAERAELSCRLAKQLEKAGDYEAARDALDELWLDRTAMPTLEGLDASGKAEVLLRAGTVAGWLGAADQTGGDQETAKNLLTKSVEIFQQLGQTRGLAEARG